MPYFQRINIIWANLVEGRPAKLLSNPPSSYDKKIFKVSLVAMATRILHGIEIFEQLRKRSSHGPFL